MNEYTKKIINKTLKELQMTKKYYTEELEMHTQTTKKLLENLDIINNKISELENDLKEDIK